jgi:hypothetical protein
MIVTILGSNKTFRAGINAQSGRSIPASHTKFPQPMKFLIETTIY